MPADAGRLRQDVQALELEIAAVRNAAGSTGEAAVAQVREYLLGDRSALESRAAEATARVAQLRVTHDQLRNPARTESSTRWGGNRFRVVRTS